METDLAPAPPVALVTGARAGVGLALTTRLLAEGWDVAVLVRSPLPADSGALDEARRAGRLRTYLADLADGPSLSRALDEVRARETRIDWLVNNAAVSLDAPSAAPSGRDVHFEVNTLAPYVITEALLPLVEASAHKTVLNVSSNASLRVKDFSLAELERPSRFRKLFGSYAASKLALSLWTAARSRELGPRVRLLSACPGPVDSQMSRGGGMPFWLRPLVPLMFRAPDRGAQTLLEALRSPHGNGVFLHRGAPTKQPYAERAAEVLDAVRAAANVARVAA